MNNKLIVINLFGGPGSGKSTQAAMLFAKLKMKGCNVELVTEYAKDLTWQESQFVLKNQLYIFAKQHHRIWRLQNKVDIVITDSPLIQNLIYSDGMSDDYKKLVVSENEMFNNINILLKRPNVYENHGRIQTKEESMIIDDRTFDLFEKNNQEIHLTTHVGEDDVSSEIYRFITTLLNLNP